MTGPSSEQAFQFALIMSAGMPASEAVRYFLPEDAEDALNPAKVADQWLKSKAVSQAILKLQGKSWQDMTAEERWNYAINKNYNEAAYYLYSHNYATLSGSERQKADKCREILESKLAGTAGQRTPVEQWWADVMSGKVKLTGSADPTPLKDLSGFPSTYSN